MRVWQTTSSRSKAMGRIGFAILLVAGECATGILAACDRYRVICTRPGAGI